MPLQTRLTTALGTEHPILLAPMDLVAGGKLAAAVSHAGGLGLIGGGYGNADWLERIPYHDGYKHIIRSVERQIIAAALAETAGNKLKAAGLLGIQRRLLYEKIREHGLR